VGDLLFTAQVESARFHPRQRLLRCDLTAVGQGAPGSSAASQQNRCPPGVSRWSKVATDVTLNVDRVCGPSSPMRPRASTSPSTGLRASPIP